MKNSDHGVNEVAMIGNKNEASSVLAAWANALLGVLLSLAAFVIFTLLPMSGARYAEKNPRPGGT